MQDAGCRMLDAGWRKAGGRRQEAGGRRQEAGGRCACSLRPLPLVLYPWLHGSRPWSRVGEACGVWRVPCCTHNNTPVYYCEYSTPQPHSPPQPCDRGSQHQAARVSSCMHTCPRPHASCLLPRASCPLRPGSWLLAPGFWLLAPGSWLLAPGSWLLASCILHVSLLPPAACLCF